MFSGTGAEDAGEFHSPVLLGGTSLKAQDTLKSISAGPAEHWRENAVL